MTKKRRAQKSVSSHTVMPSVNGTRRTNAPSSGTSFNGRKQHGEHFRVFPLSNWTEMDIWQYIKAEEYRAAAPLLLTRARLLRARRGDHGRDCDFIELLPGENS